MAALAGGMPVAGARRQPRHRARRQRTEMGQGAVPVLRHRLQRDGGDQGQPRGRDPWRHQVGGQSRPQLRQGLFPLQDHVRPRPPDPADAAQDGRQIRQERRVHAGVVGRSLRHHGGEMEGGAEEARPERRRHVRLRPVDGLGRLCGRRSCSRPASAPTTSIPMRGTAWPPPSAGFMRTFGIDEPMGCYDDIEAADAFVLWGSNMAEMHPILWTRVTDRRLSRAACPRRRAVDLRAPLVRPRRHRHDLHAADRSLHPQLHRQPHHQDRPGQQGLRRRAHRVQARPDRHRLRPAPRASAAEEGDRRAPRPTTPPTSPSTNTRSSSPTTRWRRPPRCPACRSTGSRRWPSSMPTRRSRSLASGPWASTSTPAASGATTSSTTSIC